MKHPGDAFDGKPRGKDEILAHLNDLGVPKNTILVTDSWRGTIAAVKQYRRDWGLTSTSLRHELVNHSQGEIVTNSIESRWGVLKRWIRKRYSGRLPPTTDSTKWKLLMGEFQFRKFMEESWSQERHGDLVFVAFTSCVKAFRV